MPGRTTLSRLTTSLQTDSCIVGTVTRHENSARQTMIAYSVLNLSCSVNGTQYVPGMVVH